MSALTHSITCSISLDSIVYDITSSYTISSLSYGYIRKINVPSEAEIQILSKANTVAAGTPTSFQHTTFMNRSQYNAIRLRLVGSGGNEFHVRVEAGREFHLSTDSFKANTTDGAFSSYTQIEGIYAQSEGSPSILEFITI